MTRFRDLAGEVAELVEAVEIARPAPREKVERGSVPRRALLTAPLQALQAARDEPVERVWVERPLHPAVRLGLGQALLRAVALVRGMSPAAVVAAEWDLPAPAAPVAVHIHAGPDWHYDAERAIARRADSLPGAVVDHVEGQVGAGGAELNRYLQWLAERIRALGGSSYQPVIHVDLQGALGQIHHDHVGHMLGQVYGWQLAAAPFKLRLEDPVLKDDRAAEISSNAMLRAGIQLRKMRVELAAGAGVRTLDDVMAYIKAGAVDLIHLRLPVMGDLPTAVDAALACKQAGMGVLIDGGVASTDLTAGAAAHLALATGADFVSAGPGTGVDEGLSLVRSEMARALALMPMGSAAGPGAGPIDPVF